MWSPPGAKKHPLPQAYSPSLEQARAARLFSPLQEGRLGLATRTWVPAMVPWRADNEGFVTPRVLAWYERFAQGKPGAIVVEATGIRDIPSGPLLRIGDDRFLPGLAQLTRTVREASGGETRLFIQLIDFLRIRRRPPREAFLRRFLRIEPHHRAFTGLAHEAEVREALVALDDARLCEALSEREWEALMYGERERVTDVHLPAIRDLPRVLPELFSNAAGRAEAAGFDGVELHYAHAYTMASFLSARNDRQDGYGGSPKARVRAPVEVLRAVRQRVGKAFVVGARLLSDEIITGGSRVEDAIYYAQALASAGADFLSLSRGGKFEDAKQPKVGAAAYPYTGESGWECMPTVRADARGPFGRNVEATSQVRAALREADLPTPIVVAGGIATFQQAETILAEGAADIVAAARQSLADPDWFLKLRDGRGERIRRCAFTNYCEGLDQMHKPVTCKLWDRRHLDEPGVDMVDGRRLLAPSESLEDDLP